MRWIGIDPGASGGIAWVDGYGRWEARPMPKTERDIWLLVFGLGMEEEKFALIEKVGAFPGQGVVSSFNFGGSYFGLRMALTAADIPWELVTPQRWQKEFSLIFPKSKGLSLTQKKNLHKAKAQQLFPGGQITHATADALLIAEYARRTRR